MDREPDGEQFCSELDEAYERAFKEQGSWTMSQHIVATDFFKWYLDGKLKAQEMPLLLILRALQGPREWCTPTNHYLAGAMRVSEGWISHCLKEMDLTGLITLDHPSSNLRRIQCHLGSNFQCCRKIRQPKGRSLHE